MPGSILGTAVRRVEDPELIRGRATYVDNIVPAGALHLVFVRSPLAHALVENVDVAKARAAPGVVAVLTATDLADVPDHRPAMVLNDACARPLLARGKVRFVGDMVAAVVATTRADAVDAAELVEVDYDPLPPVVDPEAALDADAPLQFEELGSNLASGVRDPDDVRPLDGADVVVRARMVNQRLAVAPMEGNAVTATPGAPDEAHDMTVHVSTQMPHGLRAQVAAQWGWELERVRVVAPHVGGGFGGKAGLAPEHAVVIETARRLGRVVTWTETRSENLTAMPHGRGQVQYGELGLRRDGTIVGLRARVVGDAGAYAGFGGALALGPTRNMAQGVYRIPTIAYDAAAVLTTTTPMGAFRGAGRPEAAAMLERLMDLAADELTIDPAELRRRNFLAPEDFPLTTATGSLYDSGDYAKALDKALELAGYDDLRAEQARRRERNERVVLGIGLAVYVEVTAGGAAQEYGKVTVDDGGATVAVGTSAHGQGHATSFAMIVADRLGIPMERVRFVQSDTAVVPHGGGTGGSRSLQLAGSSVLVAADAVLERAREVVASVFEAAPDDVVVTDSGGLGIAGVPGRELTWREVAAAAHEQGVPLAEARDESQPGATYPFGAHVSVVEVDLDTGRVVPVRHVAVDDCGRVLNPTLVAGQQHGGLAQGISQALWEGFSYDEDGNPTTGSFAAYLLPTAVEVPTYEAASTETPTPYNPLGAKGIGEAATVGSTPAVQNAVVDALRPLGVRHLDMPLTPERVWRAVRDAEAGVVADPWREPPSFFATLPVRGTAVDPEAASVDI
ncbi:xanthine dehydrogenase family protein molybdopterin-binding subunit [Actinomycetospora endophytica]|uniref:Xanthine dehydrogenase family protein molybdopterin-binding subunit n=1 Tax=Actinomycetospora endophytica TaxID=2291215 RepID=A0ABS8PDY4_9PSEU|nr:xanthine dehydrogenase family protein molybdopterin-binding subunit [Actinomycetospora endophytica]MCD2196369.1 xanthine dehydrogenase family protein molybdopterin-binding subunit [Actinomycetospora endophytica]